MAERLTERDKQLVREAIERKSAGTKLTQRQRVALDKAERIGKRTELERLVECVPREAYIEWSGRNHQQLERHRHAYGVPCTGDQIDVRACIQALHCTIAENAGKIKASDTIDTLVEADDDTSPWLEKLRAEQFRRAKRENDEAERKLIQRDDVSAMVSRLSTAVREGAQVIEAEHGRRASAEILDRVEAVLRQLEESLT